MCSANREKRLLVFSWQFSKVISRLESEDRQKIQKLLLFLSTRERDVTSLFQNTYDKSSECLDGHQSIRPLKMGVKVRTVDSGRTPATK